MNKQEVKERIKKLVERYESEKQVGKIKGYTEEETKKDFILPLFGALGWDVHNKKEVTAEEEISGDRVDYGFYLNDRVKFYLEAKPLKADLHKPEFADQAVRYSWNKGVIWAVLTDFESIKVFNAQDIRRSLADKLFFEIPYSQYLHGLDQLLLLSREAFLDDLIDKVAEQVGKKFQKVPVNELLFRDLNVCRGILTKSLSAWNKGIGENLLDEGVQRLLDRLIFLRVAEDRGIEPPTLIPLLRQWEARKDKNEVPLYKSMVEKFRELDKTYNSNLFNQHPFENWEEYGGATEKVINILYGKKGYYEYDFKVIPADVLGAVYENYLGYKLSQSKKITLFGENIEISKDSRKRKEQGIYYTPTFIVDYIVKNSLKPVLDKCKSIDDLKKVKVLDPACGSGSFLIKALDLIYEKYREFGDRGRPIFTKIQILTQNIYGVDLDAQAVELARLNLLINSLDSQFKLPLLNNIKQGNSLISGTNEELKKYFGKNFRDKKPFNWEEEFPEVFKQGGFDVIIGNPPYLKEMDNKEIFEDIKKSNYRKFYQGKMDFWYFFLHRALDVSKQNGYIAFITNSYFLKSAGASKLISRLKNEAVLVKAIDLDDIKIFGNVSGKHIIHIWRKIQPEYTDKTLFINLNKKSFENSINDSNVTEMPYLNLITNDNKINFLYQHDINFKNCESLGDLYDISQGVVEANAKISKKASANLKDKKYKAGDGIFVLSKKEIEALKLNPEEVKIIKRYLDTKDVKRYSINFNDQFLIYSDKITKEKVKDGYYPNIKNHLDDLKKFITSSNRPYGLHRPRESKYFESPKLICKEMFLVPEFSYDEDRYYVGFSFAIIIKKEDKKYNLKYLLGILNSKLGSFWFRNNGKRRGVGVDVGIGVFKKFPVYKATVEHQKTIIFLTDRMLNLNQQLKQTDEGSNKWQELKSEIEKTDKKIDEEVYKLYGLTPEEIQIVENSEN